MIVLMGRVELLLREGRVPEAREAHRQMRATIPGLPTGEHLEAEWLITVDAAVLMAEGRLAEAETLVYRAIETSARRSDMPDLAGVLEMLARIRHQQGKPESAARLLALTAVIRGRLDLGNPEVREMIAALTEKLGPRYAEIAAETAQLSRTEGIEWLLAQRPSPEDET
jgi:predicted Zn-dependent protease